MTDRTDDAAINRMCCAAMDLAEVCNASDDAEYAAAFLQGFTTAIGVAAGTRYLGVPMSAVVLAGSAVVESAMELAHEHPERENAQCDQPCDHCRPEMWHQCQLAAGHTGWHTCVPDATEQEATA